MSKKPSFKSKDTFKDEYDLKRMPAGYRHYKCTKYTNPKEAHRVLATQVLHLDKVSPLLTQGHTIRREFIQKDLKVPAYMVTGFRNITQLR